MSIIVTTCTADPIDLTASLIKAHNNYKIGKPCKVDWIIEKGSEDGVFEQLDSIRREFPYLDININHQINMSGFNPSNEEILSLLTEILSYVDVENGMIRIHHGAVVLLKDNLVVRCRYFGMKNGSIVLCDNKKKPHFYNPSNGFQLNLEGSMNLCLIHKNGELAHLPWYCIDSPIYPFEVEEVITPPEGCSNSRFAALRNRLIPSGYSVNNYFDIYSYGNSLEKWLWQYGTVVASRKHQGSRCTKTLISRLAMEKKNSVKDIGFYECLNHLKKPVYYRDKRIENLLLIWSLAQIMVSYDQGFFDEIRETGVIKIDNQLRVSRNIIADFLIDSYKACSCNSRLLNNKHIEHVFGMIASSALSTAYYEFDDMFHTYFYQEKASLPQIIEKNRQMYSKKSFFDVLLNQRTERNSLLVKGSVFEFEAYKTINARMDVCRRKQNQ